MDDLTRNLERLGQTVADGLDQSKSPADLQAARLRFLSASGASRRPTKRILGGLLLAASCAAALGFYLWTRPAPVSFAIGSPPMPGSVGNWISAGESPTELRFSEGTALALAPGARVRVTETNPRGAAILIEKGTLHAKVTHAHHDTQWAFNAGPFQVRVTGTEFDASWDPSTESFEVTMNEGSVFTTGPLLHNGRHLAAGEHLRVSIRDQKLEIHVADSAKNASVETNSVPTNPALVVPATSAEAMPSALLPAETNHSGAVEHSGQKAPDAPQAALPTEPDWRSMASSGKYKEALAAAEKEGFSQIVARANAADLLALADMARLAGNASRAREALLAARTRHGVRGRTAFLIGKIAADQQGSAADAAVWFETYLREEPGGQLAEQALGRLIEIHRRGNAAAARGHAEQYLAKYPRGAYAALARSVLEP